MRVFVAFDLAIPVVENLILLQEDLHRPLGELGAKPRWTKAENIHLTLRFIGKVDRALVYRIRESLRDVARANPMFEVSTNGTGCFPSSSRPRVLWAGTSEGEKTVHRLQAGLERSLVELGIEPETRPFHPHVTLGRLKTFKKKVDVTELLLPYRDTDFGKSLVKDLVLFESTLQPSGAVYTVVERFPLTG